MRKYTQPRGINLIKRKGNNINKNSIGIISNKHIRATESFIKSLKQDLLNLSGPLGPISKFFFILFKLPCFNKILTHKGILVRMGKGKGKIISKYLNIYPNQIIFLLYLKQPDSQGFPNLQSNVFSKFFLKYPFLSITPKSSSGFGIKSFHNS